MGATELVLALAKIFIMILPGYVLAKMNLIEKKHTEGMANVITNVAYPCLVINATQMEFSWDVLNNCKYVVLIFLTMILIAIGISKLISMGLKLPNSQSGVMAFMMVFGNTGFIGLPVLNGLFEKEAVFYGALCDSTFDVLMFSVGVMLIRQAASGDEKMGILQTMKGVINPCFIGVLIGLTLYVCRIELPEILGGPIATIGAIASPLAMMIVGSNLARISILNMLKSKYSYIACFLKLIVGPAIALVLVKLIIGGGTLFGTVIVMQAAMPCAMLCVVFSERYKADVEFATKGVMLTTLMCIVTIPLVAIATQYI